MPPTNHLDDSQDSWKYIIILSKFVILFVDGGIAKSFGVLIPEMVARYDSDYRTIALICGLHSLMFITAPIGKFLLKVMTPQQLGMAGGLLTAIPIMCVPFANSVFVLGVVIASTGFGITMTVFVSFLTINDFFRKSFISANTLTLFGTTCGAFTVPVIVEKSLEAYGYQGAFLILGGISLHTVVSGAIIRPPKDLASMREGNVQFMHDTHSPSERNSTLELQEPLLARDQEHVNCGTESEENNDYSRSNIIKLQKDAIVSFFRSLPSVRQLLTSFILVTEPLCTLAIPAVLLTAHVFYGWLLFLVPHAESLGIERSRAVFLSTIAGISGVFGRIVFLFLLHFNYNATLILGFCCLISAISFFLDTLSSTFIFLSIMASLQGFVLFVLDSVSTVMMRVAVSNEENMPTAISLFMFMEAAGGAAGDTLSGYLYDVTSSMHTVFISYGIALVIVMINLFIFSVIDRCKAPVPSAS